VISGSTTQHAIDGLARAARNLVVDPNEFPDEFAAENASAAVVLTLELCQNPDPQAVVQVASRSFETAEGIVIQRRGLRGAFKPADLDAELATAPLIRGELEWQDETLKTLEAAPLDENLVSRLRKVVS
jgi:Protein of unknown function (DUF416)